MSWGFKIGPRAIKDLRKIGHEPARRVLAFLEERVNDCDDPRRFGKPLKGDLGEFWRYRVDDYRVLCRIEDGQMTVLVVRVRHRRDAYV